MDLGLSVGGVEGAQSGAPAVAPHGRKPIAALGISVVAAFAIVLMVVAPLGTTVRRPGMALAKSDFAAFYCGSVIALEHRDPYALSPLQACEFDRVDIPADVNPKLIGIDPDPFPGYSMAFFAPFTLVAYHQAALMWAALLVCAIAGTAALIASITGVPFITVAAILAFADGVLSVYAGQVPPVLVFGLALAAFGLMHKRHELVFIGAALSMIEPHIGFPACCAIFVWRPELRRGLIAVALALCIVSVVVLGVKLNLEYARIELPAHAQAEATTSIQYSLAWLLHYLGVSDTTAIRLAAIQYGVFVIAGIAFAGVVARKLAAPAALVFFPPSVALIGGSFVHLQQIAAAIPLALLLAVRLRGVAATVAWLATGLLAVPWPAGSRPFMLGGCFILVTVVLAALRNHRTVVAVGCAFVGAGIYAALAGPVLTHLVPNSPDHRLADAPRMARALDGARLASEEDAREVRTGKNFALATPRTLAAKLPTWLALCAIVALAALSAPVRPGRGARPAEVHPPNTATWAEPAEASGAAVS